MRIISLIVDFSSFSSSSINGFNVFKRKSTSGDIFAVLVALKKDSGISLVLASSFFVSNIIGFNSLVVISPIERVGVRPKSFVPFIFTDLSCRLLFCFLIISGSNPLLIKLLPSDTIVDYNFSK